MIQFRKIKANELDLLYLSLHELFGLENFKDLTENYEIIVGEGKWKEVFLISDRLMKVFQKFKDYRNPYFMGLFLGDIKNEKFKISLPGLTLISNHIKNKTVLSDLGEKRVLYGRDLTKQDISLFPPKIKKNDFSVLINENKEVLALGKYLFDQQIIQRLKNDKKILKNIIDKGWYLRRGK